MSAGTSPGGGLGRRVARNTFHAASGRMAGVIVWIAFAPAILKNLGEEGFGLWALFFAVTGHFAALDFGLVQGTLRHVAAARERGDHARGGAFATVALAGFVLLATAWVLLTALGQASVLAWLRIPANLEADARFMLFAAPLVFLAAGCANVMMSIMQAYGRFDLGNRVALALTAQHAIGIPIVLHLGWGLRGLVINVGLGWSLGAILGAVMAGGAAPGFRLGSLRSAFAHAREAAAFGGPLQITNGLSVANLHVDKFLLSRWVALAAVTPYELGARVASAAVTFPQLLLLAVLPAVAELHARGEDGGIRALYVRGNRYVLVATGAVVAALFAAADRLFLAWLGPGLETAAFLLRGLTLALGCAMLAGMASTVARGIGRTDIEAWFHVVSLSVHVSLSLWLLPLIGIRGTVIAVVTGNVAGAIVLLLLLARTLRWSWPDLLAGQNLVPVLATGAGVLVGWLAHRLLPGGSGLAAWAGVVGVAGVAAFGVLAVVLITRYVAWRELWALRAGGSPAGIARRG